MSTFELGSRTAKGGFANERDISLKFNNYRTDTEAQLWLKIMGYEWNKISELNCLVIPAHITHKTISNYYFESSDIEEMLRHKKADLQVKVIIKIGNVVSYENISLKKADIKAGFNHVDRRWVDFYQQVWKFDDEIKTWLKLFTGETEPKTKKDIVINYKNLRDKRRVFINEMDKKIQNKIIKFFEANRLLIITDILKGRGRFSADWMLVTMFDEEANITTWILKDINTVMNFYNQGKVRLSPQGSLLIGKIFMQRKGGTGNPNQLQFKFNPNQLFKLDD